MADEKNMRNLFSSSRFFTLIWFNTRKDLLALLLKTGSVLGVLLLINLLNSFFGQTQDLFGIYTTLFFLLGTLITSGNFRSYYSKRHSAFLLMLPASRFEKWLEKFLGSTLVWIVFSFIAFTLYAFLSAGLSKLFFGFYSSPIWWKKDLLYIYLSYLAVHGVFFAGASLFRKNPLFKTLLTLGGLGILFSIFWLLMFKTFLSKEVMQLAEEMRYTSPQGYFYRILTMPQIDRYYTFAEWSTKIFFWVLVPLYCWVFSFIRFREIEEKDAV